MDLRAHIHCVARGTGTPKDRDEVTRIGESFGCVMGECQCDLEPVDVTSIFKTIRSTPGFPRMLPTLDLSSEENTERWKWKLVYVS